MNVLDRKIYDVMIGSSTKTSGDNSHVREFVVQAHDVVEAINKVRTYLKKNEYVESCELVRRLDIS